MSLLPNFVFRAFGMLTWCIGRFWDSNALCLSANARGKGFRRRMGFKFRLLGVYSGNGGQNLIFGGARASSGCSRCSTLACPAILINGCMGFLQHASALFLFGLKRDRSRSAAQ